MTFISLKKRPTTALFSLFFLFLGWGASLQAGPKEEIQQLVQEGAVLLADEKGQILFSIHPDRFFVPASIVKILTAQIALEEKGPDARFHTEIYQKGHRLWIKGGGDPFLVSEEIQAIAVKLKARGIVKVTKLGLDANLIPAKLVIPGIHRSSNPYDALNGALVVNFNSLFVGRDKKGRLYSAEPQTPLTPLGRLRGQHMRRGQEERINLTMDQAESLGYSGELFLAIFKKEGIDTSHAQLEFGATPKDYQLVERHANSKPLTEVLIGLLRYSNNFIANQILLSLDPNPPWEMESALGRYQVKAKQILGDRQGGAHFAEASGISRKNRVTARQMLVILEAFRPYESLLSEKHGSPVKSGTLTGVYNYAGYIRSPKGLRPVVILLSQRRNHRDRILKLLQQL